MQGLGYNKNVNHQRQEIILVEETWLPIIDYAHVTGKSISTLRRYIKAAKVEYKLEDGKYLIKHRGPVDSLDQSSVNIKRDLSNILQEKEDEITELKMLVKLYEKKLRVTEEPPALPVN